MMSTYKHSGYGYPTRVDEDQPKRLGLRPKEDCWMVIDNYNVLAGRWSAFNDIHGDMYEAEKEHTANDIMIGGRSRQNII